MHLCIQFLAHFLIVSPRNILQFPMNSSDLQNSAMAAQQLHHSPAPAVPHLGNGFHHHTTPGPGQQQSGLHPGGQQQHHILSPAARRPPFVPSVSVHPQPPVGGTYKCQVRRIHSITDSKERKRQKQGLCCNL